MWWYIILKQNMIFGIIKNMCCVRLRKRKNIWRIQFIHLKNEIMPKWHAKVLSNHEKGPRNSMNICRYDKISTLFLVERRVEGQNSIILSYDQSIPVALWKSCNFDSKWVEFLQDCGHKWMLFIDYIEIIADLLLLWSFFGSLCFSWLSLGIFNGWHYWY